MFERYTEGARRVLFFARYEVSRLGSRSIEPEHLLLGLTREPHRGLAGQLFSRAHVSLQGVCTEIERGIVIGQRIPTSVEVPFSKPTKQILEWAASEADRLKSAAIDTEHLLLGILRNEQTRAASILMRLGMNLRTVREDVVELRNAETTSSETPQDSAVRIAPTRKRELGISSRGRPGSLELEGFTLRDVLAQVCGVHTSRIELPSWVDHAARYDLSAAWPEDRLHQTGHDLIRGGIERHFGVTVAHEPQWLDVYVVTAPEGTSATGIDADNLGGGGIGSARPHTCPARGDDAGRAPEVRLDLFLWAGIRQRPPRLHVDHRLTHSGTTADIRR